MPGGGLCGDEGGLDTLPPPSEEAGDAERSGAAEDPYRRDGVFAAAEVPAAAAAAGSAIFLRGILEQKADCYRRS